MLAEVPAAPIAADQRRTLYHPTAGMDGEADLIRALRTI
jgi:hypothetical protein